MNPRFIFNALNSVNHFISQNDERTANKFLSEFSRLMRLVLENSQEDFISLQKEEEIISLYVKLEHYRFRDKFDYQIHLDENLNKETLELPPMLIQPYIENAVWHGLRYKESKGNLDVHIGKDAQGLKVEILDHTDNCECDNDIAILAAHHLRQLAADGIITELHGLYRSFV